MSERRLQARAREGGPREVRALVRAFNSMAARLQTNDEQRRSLMADVTHELRTPITIIQGNLEGMLDGIYPADREHIAAILEETHTVIARGGRPAHAVGGRKRGAQAGARSQRPGNCWKIPPRHFASGRRQPA